MAIDHEKLQEYAALKLRVRELDEQKKKINKDLAEIEGPLLEQFEQTQTKNITVLGVGTVYLSRTGWAKVVRDGERATPEEKQRACEALRAAGLGQYVEEGFNSQKVSALFREMAKDGESLPSELDGAIDFDVGYELKVQKTG